MKETSENREFELDRVVDDLRAIAAGAVREKKESGQPIRLERLREELDEDLAVDFRDYVSFLADSKCIELDSGGEQLELREGVTRPLKNRDDWVDFVAENFRVSGGTEKERSAESDEAEESSSEDDGVSAPSESDQGAEPSREAAADRERSQKASSPPRVPGTPSEEVGAGESSPETGARYDHVGEIGSGGFGTVYKARDTALDRAVAIKEIRNIFEIFAQLDPDEVGRQFAELTRDQAKLSHPAVVEVHDLDTSGEFPFAVTEYAPKGSLRRLIAEGGTADIQVAFEYFVQVLHGLRAAHEQGLLHGNIKPENVVLDRHGNAKLSDFGLTNLVALEDSIEQVYIGVSAVEYKAPEELKSREAASVQSDIYSLGILFYEMLTGDVPGRRSPMPSEWKDEIPGAVDDIFDRMASDAPEDRYDSVEAVLTDFLSAPEVVDVLDRRSGVVFLDDPIDGDGKPPVREEIAATGADDRGGREAPSSSGTEMVPASEKGVEEDDSVESFEDNRSWWQKLFG